MHDVMANSISVAHIHRVLKDLFDDYQREKEEGRAYDDTRYMEYWDSACQTISEVAGELGIPLEEQQGMSHPHKQYPYQPDSMMPDNGDLQPTDETNQKTASRAFSS